MHFYWHQFLRIKKALGKRRRMCTAYPAHASLRTCVDFSKTINDFDNIKLSKKEK